jgi:hypothetical protein
MGVHFDAPTSAAAAGLLDYPTVPRAAPWLKPVSGAVAGSIAQNPTPRGRVTKTKAALLHGCGGLHGIPCACTVWHPSGSRRKRLHEAYGAAYNSE